MAHFAAPERRNHRLLDRYGCRTLDSPVPRASSLAVCRYQSCAWADRCAEQARTAIARCVVGDVGWCSGASAMSLSSGGGAGAFSPTPHRRQFSSCLFPGPHSLLLGLGIPFHETWPAVLQPLHSIHQMALYRARQEHRFRVRQRQQETCQLCGL